MARLATFQWHSPLPTSVDEVLVIEEQPSRASRSGGPGVSPAR